MTVAPTISWTKGNRSISSGRATRRRGFADRAYSAENEDEGKAGDPFQPNILASARPSSAVSPRWLKIKSRRCQVRREGKVATRQLKVCGQ